MINFDLNAIINDLHIRRIQGGLREFQRTGIYPDKIIFSSSLLAKSWRLKVKTDNQSGSIKFDGGVIFNYRLFNDCCEIQIMDKIQSDLEWIRKDILITMCD